MVRLLQERPFVTLIYLITTHQHMDWVVELTRVVATSTKFTSELGEATPVQQTFVKR
jgi:hypothetical protein